MVRTGSKYSIGERIGAGGMAEVFRGSVIGTQGFARPVAIKRMRPSMLETDPGGALLVHEARIMASLRHPNIVAVSDFQRDDDGALLLVMELVDGLALRELVSRGPVPCSVAIYIAIELLRGLAYLHDLEDDDGNPLNLIHHDLSAGNVLLSWDGAVKISDFGLARARRPDSLGDSDLYGTPAYMAPEHIRGLALDGRADLFAVGVLLYELLTGARPWDGADPAAVMDAILRDALAPPREARPEIAADLEAIVLQLLARDPEQRPRSATAVLHALEQCSSASLGARSELAELLRERSVPGNATSDSSDSEAVRVTLRLSRPGQLARRKPGAEREDARRLAALRGPDALSRFAVVSRLAAAVTELVELAEPAAGLAEPGAELDELAEPGAELDAFRAELADIRAELDELAETGPDVAESASDLAELGTELVELRADLAELAAPGTKLAALPEQAALAELLELAESVVEQAERDAEPAEQAERDAEPAESGADLAGRGAKRAERGAEPAEPGAEASSEPHSDARPRRRFRPLLAVLAICLAGAAGALWAPRSDPTLTMTVEPVCSDAPVESDVLASVVAPVQASDSPNADPSKRGERSEPNHDPSAPVQSEPEPLPAPPRAPDMVPTVREPAVERPRAPRPMQTTVKGW